MKNALLSKRAPKAEKTNKNKQQKKKTKNKESSGEDTKVICSTWQRRNRQVLEEHSSKKPGWTQSPSPPSQKMGGSLSSLATRAHLDTREQPEWALPADGKLRVPLSQETDAARTSQNHPQGIPGAGVTDSIRATPRHCPHSSARTHTQSLPLTTLPSARKLRREATPASENALLVAGTS